MIPKRHNSFQIFLQSPDLKIPIQTQTLTLTPILIPTLHHLKLSLFPQSPSLLYFTLNGKSLIDSTPISQIAPLSTLILQIRASGGGGDGGATGAESRDCYLNMYAEKKPDKVDPYEQRLSKFLNCSLSNEPLKDPCVVDLLGNVFNKQALVEALLGKKVPKEFGYIRGLRDMVPVHFAAINGVAESETRFQCPITGLEFNGKYKFLALKGCGHVISAKALKEVKSSGCLICHVEYSEEDKIVINGNEEEVVALRERMEAEKAKTTRVKKAKKAKIVVDGVANGEEEEGVAEARVSGKKHGIDVKGAEKASAKVDGDGNGKVVENNGKGASNGGGAAAAKRFKAGEAVPANATKSVYASIFTSSSTKKFKETYSCRSLPLGRN